MSPAQQTRGAVVAAMGYKLDLVNKNGFEHIIISSVCSTWCIPFLMWINIPGSFLNNSHMSKAAEYRYSLQSKYSARGQPREVVAPVSAALRRFSSSAVRRLTTGLILYEKNIYIYTQTV